MIGFRVDANSQIASGHLMRCITIAKELVKLNEDVIFLLADKQYIDFLGKLGFKSVSLDCDYTDWDSSIEQVKYAVNAYSISVLFIDSYLVTPSFFYAITPIVKTVYIDDEFRHCFNVNMIIAPTQSKDIRLLYSLYDGTNTKLLTGKDYLLLREEFRNFHKKETKGKEILITTGGSDPFHLSINLLKEIIGNKDFNDLYFTFILGLMNCDYEEICRLSQSATNITVIKNADNMGEIFSHTYAAISGGGNTIYELLACQIPTICLALSDDQAALGERLSHENLLLYVGDERKSDITEKIIVELHNLIYSDETYNDILRSIGNYSDGMGAIRAAKAIIRLQGDC